ncbi:uncharacterized protein [Diadema antillarum]|uniref:uncharacterized protein n=1 Tax=Diadema antillarum TaxID=105358 RepID=UPI003A876123
MGNCLKSCFGQVNTKRNKYFTGRYNNCNVDIEFENLIDDDEVDRSHQVLTEEERNHLLNRRYADLVQEQQRIDAKLDRDLAVEEENARLEEEAYNAARRESARAAKQARALERQKQAGKPQSNGTAKSWLGSDAGDWEIATEDDFETFLESVKAKSETVRASVASMLNNTSTSNPVVTSQPAGHEPKHTGPVSPNARQAQTSNTTTSPQVHQSQDTTSHVVNTSTVAMATSASTLSAVQTTVTAAGPSVTHVSQLQMSTQVKHNSQEIHVGRGGGTLQEGEFQGVGQVGEGRVDPDEVSSKPDVLSETSKVTSPGTGDIANNKKDEGMSYYIQPHQRSTNEHTGNDDSDVEWEADFVSADSTPEPITVPASSSTSSSSTTSKVRNTPSSSNSTGVAARPRPTRTGPPTLSSSNGPSLANGRIPHSREEEVVTSSSAQPAASTLSSATSSSGPTVKPKKSLDIDIEKFLEELELDT